MSAKLSVFLEAFARYNLLDIPRYSCFLVKQMAASQLTIREECKIVVLSMASNYCHMSILHAPRRNCMYLVSRVHGSSHMALVSLNKEWDPAAKDM